jgi:hypothetical protein
MTKYSIVRLVLMTLTPQLSILENSSLQHLGCDYSTTARGASAGQGSCSRNTPAETRRLLRMARLSFSQLISR